MALSITVRRVAVGVVAATMLCSFFYGLIRFPDGPIRPCAAQKYCGKQGQAHSLEQYNAYVAWETTMLYLWPVGLVSLFLLRR